MLSKYTRPNRLNNKCLRPATVIKKPKQYKSEEYLKGSGKLGDKDGINCDLYDRKYDRGDIDDFDETKYIEKCISDDKKIKLLQEQLNSKDLSETTKSLIIDQNRGLIDVLNFVVPDNESIEVSDSLIEEDEYNSDDDTDEEFDYDTDELCEDSDDD